MRFRTLSALLEEKGRFVLLSDLLGVSGALFRLYWPANEARPAGESAAGICSGAPLERAAGAYGFRIERAERGGGSSLHLVETGGADTLADRIRRFTASLAEGIRLYREREFVAGEERFYSGRRAYGKMIDRVSNDIVPGRDRCDEELPALLDTIGKSRIVLGNYLDRIGNFLGTGSAIAPFVREGKALLEAGRLVEGRGGLRDENRSAVVSRLREAEKNCREGFAVILPLVGEMGRDKS